MDEEGDEYPLRWRLFGAFSGKVKFHMVTSMADDSLTGEADALRRNQRSYSTQDPSSPCCEAQIIRL